MVKEPLAVFTDPAFFGESVSIGGVSVNVIFDVAAVSDEGFGLAFANTDPKLLAVTADLPAGIAAAPVVARGREYSVASIEDDGTGMTVIQLRLKHDTPAY